MQAYSPYYSPMPMYQQPYNPMMNAQQRLAQLEQQYPQYAQPGMSPTQMSGTLNGRIVDDFSSITANDVPMDNVGAVFFKKSGDEIQHRIWNADGTIKTTSYKPVLAPNAQQAGISSSEVSKAEIGLSESATEGIMGKLDEVMARLDKIEKSFGAKTTSIKAKKDGDTE